MKTYFIKVYVPDYILDNFEDDLKWSIEEGDDERAEYCTEVINAFNKWRETDVRVTDLDEYFSLIEKISDYVDGNYHICNNGMWIELGD